MTAEVAKYTMEQVEALELAPGTEHERLEGWIPELASEEALRQALEKAFDYRGDVAMTLKNGERIEAYIFNRQTGATLADSYEGKPFNRLNDLVVSERGGVYFSDSQGVYYLSPAGKLTR